MTVLSLPLVPCSGSSRVVEGRTAEGDREGLGRKRSLGGQHLVGIGRAGVVHGFCENGDRETVVPHWRGKH